MLGGRLFQSVGAATQKALSPTVRSLARGMMRLSFSEDRRDVDWEWESSVLYDTEHLLGNLRRTVQMRCIRNLSDLEYFLQRYVYKYCHFYVCHADRLLPKRLSAVIEAKGAATRY